MKIRNKILFCTFVLLVGCTDFLQIDPQGDLTQASFPVSSSDGLQATNAVYSAVRNWYYNSGGYPILDIMSDDAYKGSNTNDQLTTVGAYNNFTFNTQVMDWTAGGPLYIRALNGPMWLSKKYLSFQWIQP